MLFGPKLDRNVIFVLIFPFCGGITSVEKPTDLFDDDLR
jgi:hypothetical protein